MKGKSRRYRLGDIGFSETWQDLRQQSGLVNQLCDDFGVLWEDTKRQQQLIRYISNDHNLSEDEKSSQITNIQHSIDEDKASMEDIAGQLIDIADDAQAHVGLSELKDVKGFSQNTVIETAKLLAMTRAERIQFTVKTMTDDYDINQRLGGIEADSIMYSELWHFHNMGGKHRDYWTEQSRSATDRLFSFDMSWRKDWQPAFKAQSYVRTIEGKQVYIPNIRVMINPDKSMPEHERYVHPLSVPHGWEPVEQMGDMELPIRDHVIIRDRTGNPILDHRNKPMRDAGIYSIEKETVVSVSKTWIRNGKTSKRVEFKQSTKSYLGDEIRPITPQDKDRSSAFKRSVYRPRWKVKRDQYGNAILGKDNKPILVKKKIKILTKAGIPFFGSKEIGPPSERAYQCTAGHKFYAVNPQFCEFCLKDMKYQETANLLGNRIETIKWFNNPQADDTSIKDDLKRIKNTATDRLVNGKVLWIHYCDRHPNAKGGSTRFTDEFKHDVNHTYVVCPVCKEPPTSTKDVKRWYGYADKEPKGETHTLRGYWAENIRRRFMKRLHDGQVQLTQCVEYITDRETGKQKRISKQQAYIVFENEEYNLRDANGRRIKGVANVVVYCDIQPVASKNILKGGYRLNLDIKPVTSDLLDLSAQEFVEFFRQRNKQIRERKQLTSDIAIDYLMMGVLQEHALIEYDELGRTKKHYMED